MTYRLWRCFLLASRVAQIVNTWTRRGEKVEEERENGRKWRERDAALLTSLRFFESLLMTIIENDLDEHQSHKYDAI